MARPKPPDLAARARPGAEFRLRVVPRAAREAIVAEGDRLRVSVTAPPTDGKANAAVRALLAQALGVAKSRLTLVRGATSREKVYRLDPPS